MHIEYTKIRSDNTCNGWEYGEEKLFHFMCPNRHFSLIPSYEQQKTDLGDAVAQLLQHY
jgi:hypothetical protein